MPVVLPAWGASLVPADSQRYFAAYPGQDSHVRDHPGLACHSHQRKEILQIGISLLFTLYSGSPLVLPERFDSPRRMRMHRSHHTYACQVLRNAAERIDAKRQHRKRQFELSSSITTHPIRYHALNRALPNIPIMRDEFLALFCITSRIKKISLPVANPPNLLICFPFHT